MDEKKQIEEIAGILLRMDNCEMHPEIECIHDCRECYATQLYNAGFRKQSEVHPTPCKIGDKVYGLKHDFLNVVDEMTVTEVGTNGLFASEERVATAAKSSYLPYAALGDEWFLSKEDAYRERDRRDDIERRN